MSTYADVLAPQLAPGFVYREIVNGTRRKALPPVSMWKRMLRPLQLANELRFVMMDRHGAKGLRVNAAFRATGGAGDSAHKRNRALDLDLLEQDYHLKAVYYEEGARLWCEYGHDEDLGIGFYCPRDVCAGVRIHIDVGHRPYSRHWQHGYAAGRSDVVVLSERLGLHIPGRAKPVDDESEGDDG